MERASAVPDEVDIVTSLGVDSKTVGDSYSTRRGAYKCVEVVQRSLIKDMLIA